MPTAKPTPQQLADDIALLQAAGFQVSRSQSPTYVHRLAQSLRKQQQAGKTPSRTELRGHARAPVEHLTKQGHRLEQWQIRQPPDRPLDGRDFANLVRKAPKPKRDYLVVIHGLVSKYPNEVFVEGATIEKTVSVHIVKPTIQKWATFLKDKDDPLTLLQVISSFTPGMEWVELFSVGFAYPEEKP